jgi:transcriptional regulator with XRE-family HTH domain
MKLAAHLVKLKERREALRLSQGALAKRMGVTQQSVSLIENGRRSPDIPTLERYAESLGCEVVVDVVEAGEGSDLIQSLSGLQVDQLAAVLRFARLLPLLEGRDYRMRLKDLDILEEEYILRVDDNNDTSGAEGA